MRSKLGVTLLLVLIAGSLVIVVAVVDADQSSGLDVQDQVQVYEIFLPAIMSTRASLCAWPDMSDPPPLCWCMLYPGEPEDYVPMGCNPDEVVPWPGG